MSNLKNWRDCPGVWQHEPDRVDFQIYGFNCILLRESHFGHWCGYIGVPSFHPWHNKHYMDIDNVNVHGGLTYCQESRDPQQLLHEPEKNKTLWWLGFDCNHLDDLVPYNAANDGYLWKGENSVYRSVIYVMRETINLAKQAQEAEKNHVSTSR